MGSLSSETRPIAVVAAMSEELAPLRSRLTARESRAGGLTVDRGWLNGRRVVLAATGDGAAKARAGIGELLAGGPLDGLIVIGVAGALSVGLGSGALVVARRVIDEAGRAFDADAERVAAAARATGGRPGVVVSAGRIADSPSEKQRLAGLAGTGGEAAVVDLESATYLAAAVVAGVPWLVLRSVSDTADEALPELLNRSRDAGGAVRRRQVLMGLLRQPQSLPFLLTLRGRVARGAEALAVAATAVLSAFDRAGVSAVPAPGIARETIS